MEKPKPPTFTMLALLLSLAFAPAEMIASGCCACVRTSPNAASCAYGACNTAAAGVNVKVTNASSNDCVG